MPLKNNRSKKKIHFFKKKNKSKRCGGRGGRNMGETSSSSSSSSSSDNSSGSGSLRKSSSSSEESSSSSSAPSSSSSEESSSISSLSSSVEPSSPSSSTSEESSSSSSIGSLPSANASSSSRRSSIGINSGDIMDATIINQNNPQGSPSGEKLSSVALLEELLKESGPKLISSTRSSSAKTSPIRASPLKLPSQRVSSARASSARVSSARVSSPVQPNSSDVITLARGVNCLRRDYNPKSKRCLIPCKNGQARNPNNNRCAAMPKNNGPNLRQSMANLPVENIGNVVLPCGGRTEDFNPRTKRCLKPCEPNTRRNQKTMRCVKVLNVAPAQASIRRSPSREAIVVGQEAQEMFAEGVAAEPVQQMQRAQSPKKMTLKQKNTLKRFNQNSSQNSTRKVIHLLARRYQFDPVDAITYINKKLAIKTRYSE